MFLRSLSYSRWFGFRGRPHQGPPELRQGDAKQTSAGSFLYLQRRTRNSQNSQPTSCDQKPGQASNSVCGHGEEAGAAQNVEPLDGMSLVVVMLSPWNHPWYLTFGFLSPFQVQDVVAESLAGLHDGISWLLKCSGVKVWGSNLCQTLQNSLSHTLCWNDTAAAQPNWGKHIHPQSLGHERTQTSFVSSAIEILSLAWSTLWLLYYTTYTHLLASRNCLLCH